MNEMLRLTDFNQFKNKLEFFSFLSLLAFILYQFLGIILCYIFVTRHLEIIFSVLLFLVFKNFRSAIKQQFKIALLFLFNLINYLRSPIQFNIKYDS